MDQSNTFLSITSTQLLDSLREEGNQQVWVGFDARYRPIVEGVARRMGLSREDAADVAQETLTVFVRDYRRGLYQRGRGRLRTWIMTIARNRAIDLLRARKRISDVRDDSAAEVESEVFSQSVWEVEEERAIFEAAYKELMETSRADPVTLRIFEMTALRGFSTETAANECCVSVEQVRLAKHRITNRLREIVDRLTNAYTTDE
jgi:RNA polymerase sigma-70 factor, ECF subfamily